MTKWPKQASEFPIGEHWAILTCSSVFVPGDDYEDTITYQAFLTKDEFDAEMSRLANGTAHVRERCVGIHVSETFGFKTVVSPVSRRE